MIAKLPPDGALEGADPWVQPLQQAISMEKPPHVDLTQHINPPKRGPGSSVQPLQTHISSFKCWAWVPILKAWSDHSIWNVKTHDDMQRKDLFLCVVAARHKAKSQKLQNVLINMFNLVFKMSHFPKAHSDFLPVSSHQSHFWSLGHHKRRHFSKRKVRLE